MIRIAAVALLCIAAAAGASATTVTLTTGREIGFDQVNIAFSADATQINSGSSAMKLPGGAIARIVTPNFRLYRTQLDKATAERAGLSEKVTTLTAQLEAAKQRIADIEKDREHLRNTVSDDDNKFKQLYQDIETLRHPKPKPTPTPTSRLTPSWPTPPVYTPPPTFAPPRYGQTPAGGAPRGRTPAVGGAKTPATPTPTPSHSRPRP